MSYNLYFTTNKKRSDIPRCCFFRVHRISTTNTFLSLQYTQTFYYTVHDLCFRCRIDPLFLPRRYDDDRRDENLSLVSDTIFVLRFSRVPPPPPTTATALTTEKSKDKYKGRYLPYTGEMTKYLISFMPQTADRAEIYPSLPHFKFVMVFVKMFLAPFTSRCAEYLHCLHSNVEAFPNA
jgi:hypothetical protein